MNSICVNARSMSGFIKRLREFRLEQHRLGNEILAEKIYKLEEDCLFDNHLSLSSAKHRLVKILD